MNVKAGEQNLLALTKTGSFLELTLIDRTFFIAMDTTNMHTWSNRELPSYDHYSTPPRHPGKSHLGSLKYLLYKVGQLVPSVPDTRHPTGGELFYKLIEIIK